MGNLSFDIFSAFEPPAAADPRGAAEEGGRHQEDQRVPSHRGPQGELRPG